MKKRDVLLGTFMMICSLSAYVFLIQVEQPESVVPNTLDQGFTIEQERSRGTSPDVDVFKHVVTVFTELLPAS